MGQSKSHANLRVAILYTGDVLFYRDKKGQAVRRPADRYRVEPT